MAHKELTKAEEQVMQYLWAMERGFLKDIIEKFPAPRPAYTTVSTVIRVLVKKGFIAFKTYGKINEYYPLISKTDYFQRRVKPIISNYFNGSPSTFASYFTNAKLNLSELEEIKQLIDERIKKLKTKNK
jgi:BlaI family transcriptional regulator, penicillinase repressor